MKRTYPTGVVIISPSAETADALLRPLRDEGMSLRPRWVNKPGKLAEALQLRNIELVLVSLSPQIIAPRQIMNAVRKCGRDLAVVGVAARGTVADQVRDALRAGFHDVVKAGSKVPFQHAVARELKHVDHRSRLRKLRAELKESTRTLRELMNVSGQPVVFLHAGQIVHANAAWSRLMAIDSAEDLRGRPIADFLAAKEREEFLSLLEQELGGDSELVELDLEGLRADDKPVSLSLELSTAFFESRAGILLIAQNPPASAEPPAGQPSEAPVGINPRRHLLSAIDRLSSRDVEAEFIGTLACYWIENATKLYPSLGLGGFEAFADRLAERIAKAAPAHTVVARVSDDTFATFLPARSGQKAARTVAEIADALSHDVVDVESHSARAACAVGSVSVRPGDQAATVLEEAFIASRLPEEVKAPKEEPDAEVESASEEELAADLVEAMSDGRLSLIYQPIVRLHGEPIELYEAFLRLKGRHGELVPIRRVLSAAEHGNLSVRLDKWVIEHAIKVLDARHRDGQDTHLFIKLSDQCMGDIEVPLTIGRRLKASQIKKGRLIVEISETAASANLKAAKSFVESLTKVGCGTALDYFGLSNSALRLLDDVPVSFLKLDKALINALADDAESRMQVTEFCRRAAELGKHTIASYLDNPKSLPSLYESGIEFAQGYYIQEPTESMDYEFSIELE